MALLKPDVFLIGAPKCGTTALDTYLSEHSLICSARPKEPHFFCSDFSFAQSAKEENEYLQRFFSHCAGREKIAIDASVWNLFSDKAVPNILKFCPRAKFIVMLRNPVDMVYSLHSQLLFNFTENIEDFQEALDAQEARKTGELKTKRPGEETILQYYKIGKYGEQVERLFNRVAKEQIKIIIFEDFIKCPKGIYEDVLKFIGIPSDGRSEFPAINESKTHRITWLAKILFNPPVFLLKIVSWVKVKLNINSLGMIKTVSLVDERVNTKKKKRPPLSEALRKELLNEFLPDIEHLETLLERNLDMWKR